MDLIVFILVLVAAVSIGIIVFIGIFKEILDIASFGFFNAKISGLKSKMNAPSEVREMDLYELENFIEKFDKNFKKDFKSIADSSPDSVEIFFRAFHLRYEKEVLKEIMRGTEVEPYGIFTKEMIRTLRQAPLSEYPSKLEGTPYAKISFNKSLQEIERDIDFLYYREILSAAQKTDTKNATVLKRYIKTELDVRNILTVLRCKKYGVENVLDYVIPIGYEIPEWKLKNLAEAQDVSGVLDLLMDTEYKFLTELRERYGETKSLFIFEKELKKYLLNLAKDLSIIHPYTAGKALYYVILREKEVNDILAIYEAKKEEFDEILEEVIL
ncbi:MAG: V-type ATPase subunit [Euryarchaeota archaeon]|nr:V-type ATPase subunit [Euryarchaeota archaeon]